MTDKRLRSGAHGTYSSVVATAKPTPAPADDAVPKDDWIVLEAHKGGRTIAVTLTYSLVRELRDLLSRPGGEKDGLICGRLAEDAILLERSSDGAAEADAIGIFRAQPGGWATLNETDRKKLKTCGLGCGVLLVVRTLAQRPWAATLFTIEPDTTGPETPLAEFPWDEYLLRNGWLLDLAPPPPLGRPMAVSKRQRGIGWLSFIPLLLLAGVGGAAAYRWLPVLLNRTTEIPAETAAPAPVPQPLALRVVRQGQDLEVSWNRGADAIRHAGAGTLTIRNGAATRVIEMRPDQLREGRVVFRPLSGVDTDLRLEVLDSRGKPDAESVQVLGFDTAPAVTLPPPVTPAPTGSGRKSVPQQNADREESARARVPRPAASPPIVAGGHREAVPIRRATPEITPEVVREMRAAKGKVTVSVLVSINATGRVDDVKVLSSTGEPSPSGPYIRLASLNAARQWRFRPATSGGRNVPSQMTLLFTF